MELMIVHLPFIERDVSDIEKWINYNLYCAYHQGAMEEILSPARVVYVKIKPYVDFPNRVSRTLNVLGLPNRMLKSSQEAEHFTASKSTKQLAEITIADNKVPVFYYGSDLRLAKRILKSVFALQSRSRVINAPLEPFYKKDDLPDENVFVYLSGYQTFSHYTKAQVA